MKRYLLFTGYDYYPDGGWSDFKESFDSLEEAIAASQKSPYYCDWNQVVDTETMEIVCRFD